MPSKSKAQHHLMQAVAHDPAFAKKAGIPQKVGKDFEAADKKAGKMVFTVSKRVGEKETAKAKR